jgi:hypothetical protein
MKMATGRYFNEEMRFTANIEKAIILTPNKNRGQIPYHHKGLNPRPKPLNIELNAKLLKELKPKLPKPRPKPPRPKPNGLKHACEGSATRTAATLDEHIAKNFFNLLIRYIPIGLK